MSSPISISEVVRVKNQPEGDWYMVDRIYPETRKAQIHAIGLEPHSGKPASKIFPLDDLIPER
jgi:hypothetical protein